MINLDNSLIKQIPIIKIHTLDIVDDKVVSRSRRHRYFRDSNAPYFKMRTNKELDLNEYIAIYNTSAGICCMKSEINRISNLPNSVIKWYNHWYTTVSLINREYVITPFAISFNDEALLLISSILKFSFIANEDCNHDKIISLISSPDVDLVITDRYECQYAFVNSQTLPWRRFPKELNIQ